MTSPSAIQSLPESKQPNIALRLCLMFGALAIVGSLVVFAAFNSTHGRSDNFDAKLTILADNPTEQNLAELDAAASSSAEHDIYSDAFYFYKIGGLTPNDTVECDLAFKLKDTRRFAKCHTIIDLQREKSSEGK